MVGIVIAAAEAEVQPRQGTAHPAAGIGQCRQDNTAEELGV